MFASHGDSALGQGQIALILRICTILLEFGLHGIHARRRQGCCWGSDHPQPSKMPTPTHARANACANANVQALSGGAWREIAAKLL